MGSKVRLSDKAKISKAKKICRLYSERQCTIASCCEAAGVKYETFKQWVQPNLTEEDIESGNFRRGFVPEVHYLYKRALESNTTNYKALLKDATRAGILIKLSGTVIVETETIARYNEYGKTTGAIVKKTEKPVMPDTLMLIYVANNLDIFGNQGANGNKIVYNERNPFEHLTDEELAIKKLELEHDLQSDSPY